MRSAVFRSSAANLCENTRISLVSRLRKVTGLSVGTCNQTLIQFNGNFDLAKSHLGEAKLHQPVISDFLVTRDEDTNQVSYGARRCGYQGRGRSLCFNVHSRNAVVCSHVAGSHKGAMLIISSGSFLSTRCIEMRELADTILDRLLEFGSPGMGQEDILAIRCHTQRNTIIGMINRISSLLNETIYIVAADVLEGDFVASYSHQMRGGRTSRVASLVSFGKIHDSSLENMPHVSNSEEFKNVARIVARHGIIGSPRHVSAADEHVFSSSLPETEQCESKDEVVFENMSLNAVDGIDQELTVGMTCKNHGYRVEKISVFSTT